MARLGPQIFLLNPASDATVWCRYRHEKLTARPAMRAKINGGECLQLGDAKQNPLTHTAPLHLRKQQQTAKRTLATKGAKETKGLQKAPKAPKAPKGAKGP